MKSKKKPVFLNNFALFGLSKSKLITNEVAKLLNIKESELLIKNFSDGEIFVKSLESVRNKDVAVFQSTSSPVNDSLIELLITIDMLKRSSAKTITIIIPYFGYARQDRKTSGREPITAKLVANMIEMAGADKVVIMDIHSDQAQGFFDIPVDTLKAAMILLREIISKIHRKNLVIVSPDYGGVKNARQIAKKIGAPLAIIDKRRPEHNQVISDNVLGDVEGKDCIICDDMIDTGGTILAACKILKSKKSKSITVMATHGLFSNNSIKVFEKAIEDGIISDLYITNSIESNYHVNHPKIHIVNLAEFFADVLISDFTSGSVGQVYQKYWDLISD
ncbi:MAG: ribose-phosphate diphosphokinase [Mycoplasmoidaceae bacterium]